MKRVLAFDIDQTLNVAKTPITEDIADLLVKCLDHFEICPISGQKFDQFLNEMEESVLIYEAIVKTGNDVLDTILTEKSLYCQKKRNQSNLCGRWKSDGFY